MRVIYFQLINKKQQLLVIIFLIFFNCNPIKPFKSIKEQRNSIALIKKELDLNRNQFKQIKQEDSILFLLSKSLNNSVKPKRLERRLDSFLQEKYTLEELKVMLWAEYIFRNDESIDLELDRKKPRNSGIDITNVDDGSKFLDSLIEKNIKLNVKNKDSLN